MSNTKGPWAASEHGAYGDYDGNSIVILGDDLRIAVVLGYDTKETRANARLIAAAPDLLAALEALMRIVSNSNGVSGWHRNGDIAGWDEFDEINMAIAALAKAKGE